MASSLMPFIKPQWFTDAGAPAAGYKLYCYQAGTFTLGVTYSDPAMTSANAQPIVLDAYGRASVYLLAASYKFILALPANTANPPTLVVWTVDHVAASATSFTSFDLEGVAGEAISAGEAIYLSDGSGGTTAGYWFRTDATQAFSSTAALEIGIAQNAVGVGATITVRQIGQVTATGLTAGALYYADTTPGAITATAPTNALLLGRADSTTSLTLDPSWGAASATSEGLMTVAAQVYTGVKGFVTQPLVYVGGATSLPAKVGASGYSDTTAHHIAAAQSNVVMSDVTVPSSLIVNDGQALLVTFGSSVATTGVDLKTIRCVYGASPTGTLVVVYSDTANMTSWWCEVFIIKEDFRFKAHMSLYSNLGFLDRGVNTFLDTTANFIHIGTTVTTGTDATVDQTFLFVQALG